ncbi:hypothetical protein HK104_003629 [Borealophlyctis nickersoniae]|nr:hypothetical protein HK104_003629 [Borealophlyctis nickersoniae]
MYKYVFTKKLKLEFTVENEDTIPKTASGDTAVAASTEGGSGPEGAEKEGDANVTFAELPRVSVIGGVEMMAEKGGTVVSSPEEGKIAGGMAGVVPVQEPKETGKAEPTTEKVPASQAKKAPPESEDMGPAEKPVEAPPELRLTKQEIAANELRAFVTSTLSTKIDELRTGLMTRLSTQEEQVMTRLRKLEEKDDDKAKGKDVKGKKDKK